MLFFKYVLFYPLITLAWNWEGSDTAHSAMLFVSVSDGKQIVPVQHFNGQNSAATARSQLSPPAVGETHGW